ncbi:hypothetical protein FRC11_010853 [Ceratobasidium sp. 423]|nr:hypothetical protein FRC11_010853 [Ceratobasidium sp. 423]
MRSSRGSQHGRIQAPRPRTPERTNETPLLYDKAGSRFHPDVFKLLFKHERTAPDANETNHENILVRTANHFTFVNRGTFDMVRLKHDDNTKNYAGVHMIAYISPLNCGQWRGCRYLSGYTPLYRSRSQPYAWGLEGEYVRVNVKWPLMRETIEILGHGFDEVWIASDCGRIVYMLQHPDPRYKDIFERTVTEWDRMTPEGRQTLRMFQSLDLYGRCLNWTSHWVFQMLRLENRVIVRGRDNPVEGGVDDYAIDGVSDAGSVSDTNGEPRVPTSTSWDWEPEETQDHAESAQETNAGDSTIESVVHAHGPAHADHSSPLFTEFEGSPSPPA